MGWSGRLLLAAVVLGSAWVAGRYGFVCDDAFISFRYARHLAEGQGLVFNIGEQPPVEGFSNLLWVLVAAAFHGLGQSLPVVMPAVSVGCAALTLILVEDTARRLQLSDLARAVTLLTLACSPGFVIWSTSGLETMAQVMLMVMLARAWIVDGAALPGLLAAIGLMFVRTEGIGWVLVIAALGLFTQGRRLLPGVGLALVTWGVVAIWRMWYFGSFLSNTAVAKVSFDPERWWRGGQYVLGNWLATLGPPLQLLATLAVIGQGRVWLALAALAWGPAAYAVVVGGDFMAMGRLLAPGLPFVALLVGLAVERAGALRPVALASALAAIALGTLVLQDVNLVPTRLRRQFEVRLNTADFKSELEQWRYMKGNARKWVMLGRALHQGEQPGDSIVLGAVGAASWPNELFVYDRYGLVSPEVSRREGDDDRRHSPGHDKAVPITFFLDKRPTILRAELVRGEADPGRAARYMVDWPDTPAVRAQWGPRLEPVELDGQPYTLLSLRLSDEPAADWARFGRP